MDVLRNPPGDGYQVRQISRIPTGKGTEPSRGVRTQEQNGPETVWHDEGSDSGPFGEPKGRCPCASCVSALSRAPHPPKTPWHGGSVWQWHYVEHNFLAQRHKLLNMKTTSVPK